MAPNKNLEKNKNVLKKKSGSSQEEGQHLTRDQKEVSIRLRETIMKNDKICFIAPTNFGKTRTILDALKFYKGRITIVSSTYESVDVYLDEGKKIKFFQGKSVILPEGKKKIRKLYCKKTSCDGCKRKKTGKWIEKYKEKFEDGEFLNKIINAKWVLVNTDICPYRFLKEMSKYADNVITHEKMLTDSNLYTMGLLVVDEVDKALESKAITLSHFELGDKYHLETGKKSDISKALDIVNEMRSNPPYYRKKEKEEFLNRCSTAEKILEWLKKTFEGSPIKYEKEKIEKSLKEGRSVEYGLLFAHEELEKRVNEFNHLLQNGKLDALLSIFNDFKYTDYNNLPFEKRAYIASVFDILSKIENIYVRKVRKSPDHDWIKGYLEVIAITERTKLQEKIERYDKVIYMTATSPMLFPAGMVKIEVKKDRYGEKKTVVLVNEKIKDKLIAKIIEKFRVYVLTTSKKRRDKHMSKYGGCNIEDLLNGKKDGNLYWDYINSQYSRGTNKIGVLDGVIIFEYKNKSNTQYPDKAKSMLKWIKDLYQAASRVFRTINGRHRKRFCILFDRNAFEALKELAPDWNYIDFSKVSPDEILEFLEKNVDKAEPKLRIEKHVKAKEYKVKYKGKENVYGRVSLTITLPSEKIGKIFKVTIEEE